MAFTIAQAVMQLPDPTNAAAAFLSPIDQTIVTPAAGPGTGSRIDIVVGKQDNPENGDGDSRASFFLVAGTAGAPGVAPATPAGCFRWADINVPTSAATASACTVTLHSPTTFALPDLFCPTYALLSTVSGTLGQHATVTSDGTAANNGDYVCAGGTTWNLRTTIDARTTSAKSLAPAYRGGRFSGTTSAGGDLTVTFGTPFASAIWSVVVMDSNSGAGIGPVIWKLMSRSTTAFTVRAFGTPGTALTSFATTFDYVATGE
jgi:hypothetical protein